MLTFLSVLALRPFAFYLTISVCMQPSSKSPENEELTFICGTPPCIAGSSWKAVACGCACEHHDTCSLLAWLCTVVRVLEFPLLPLSYGRLFIIEKLLRFGSPPRGWVCSFCTQVLWQPTFTRNAGVNSYLMITGCHVITCE